MSNAKILDKAKLRMVNKVFPFRRSGMLLLDGIELGIQETRINQIIIPALLSPDIISDIYLVTASDITANFCPVNPEIVELRNTVGYSKSIICQNIHCSQKLRIQIDKSSIGKQLRFMCPACKDVFIYDSTTDELIEDLTSWINERLFYPAIESFSPLLGVPRKGGKSYEYDKGEDRQPTLFEFEENRECAHGLKEATCSFCLQREKSDKEKSTVIDAFDLIFPILQPPLGEDFDSPIAFPPGIELYPFQRGGIKFLVNNDEALLGDEMGLGKSIQAIVAVRFLFRMRKVPRVL